MRNRVQGCLEFRSYVTGSMSGLLILLAFPLFGAAAYFYGAALDQARPWLPIQFRDNQSERVVIDRLIWERLVPAEARRNYFLSMGSALTGKADMMCWFGSYRFCQHRAAYGTEQLTTKFVNEKLRT